MREAEIPADLLETAKAAHTRMIAAVADVDDILAEKFLAEEPITPEDLVPAIRRATVAFKMTPVFIGSAYKNKGVQLLLDGVNAYLPNPFEVENKALDQNNQRRAGHPGLRRQQALRGPGLQARRRHATAS
jgi:elongation factor G